MVSSAPESPPDRQLPVELAAEQVASLAAQPVVALVVQQVVALEARQVAAWPVVAIRAAALAAAEGQ